MATEAASTNGINLDWAIGCQLELKTTLGEEVQGTLFSYDRITNCLVLTNPGAQNGSVSYRFLKANFVKEICSAVAATEAATPQLMYIDLEESFNREEQAVRALAMEEAPSVGDIEAGQKMMSKLSRKWKCRWEGRNIVIQDKVTLAAPYSNDDFHAADEYGGLLQEIKESMLEVTPREADEDGG